jgi:hypothetical protein
MRLIELPTLQVASEFFVFCAGLPDMWYLDHMCGFFEIFHLRKCNLYSHFY